MNSTVGDGVSYKRSPSQKKGQTERRYGLKLNVVLKCKRHLIHFYTPHFI